MQIKLLALSTFACFSTIVSAAYTGMSARDAIANPGGASPMGSPSNTPTTVDEKKIREIISSPDVQNVLEFLVNIIAADLRLSCDKPQEPFLATPQSPANHISYPYGKRAV